MNEIKTRNVNYISFYVLGRKAALQHMLKTGLYSPQDVDLMKNYLNVISKVSDIWSSGEILFPI